MAARRPTIGVVSPGAMGSALGHALALGGAHVVATLAGRSERTARLAARAPIDLLPDLDSVVLAAATLISIAPPEHAETIAAEVAAAARRTGSRPLVADLNAVSPATVARIEATLGTCRLALVDGAVSGPPPWRPGTTTIYLSGSRAGELASVFSGVETIVVGETAGLASAVKMCTASVYKGSVALLAQALRTAHAHGVVGHVVADLGSSFPQLVEGAALSIGRAVAKSERYVPEMREIAATQGAAGLPPELFEALATVYLELSRHPLARRAPEELPADLSLEGVLAALQPPG